MVSANDAEAENMTLVVKDLEALCAPGSGEARDDADFTKGTNFTIPNDDVTAFDEVLVSLGIIESADNGPDGGDGGGDLLDNGRAALVGTNWVRVVASNGVRDGHIAC